MALVTAAVEPNHEFVAFTNGKYRSMWQGTGSGISPITVSPKWRLDQAVKAVSDLPFGGTDGALPMIWAAENKVPVDLFCVYTDSETWAGDIHPVQALREYRHKMGIGAKLVVIGMVSNGFCIADPDDGGMLDVVGFDAATSSVIAQFGTNTCTGKVKQEVSDAYHSDVAAAREMGAAQGKAGKRFGRHPTEECRTSLRLRLPLHAYIGILSLCVGSRSASMTTWCASPKHK
jgi:hypothetical protein